MIRFIGQRLLAAIPVLLGILFVTFALARLLPGDPCRAALGERATDALCDAFNARYGLDKPIPVQFGIYARDILRGDLGNSFRYGRPVTDLLVERLPVTVELSLAALVFATVFGILLGTDLGRPAQLGRGRRDHGRCQHRRLDAGLLAGADAGLSLRAAAEGHAVLVAAFGPQLAGSDPAVADRGLASQRPIRDGCRTRS